MCVEDLDLDAVAAARILWLSGTGLCQEPSRTAHLAAVDARKGRVIELRFFGGLSVEETDEVLKVSPDTILRDWRLAKAWLAREMGKGVAAGNEA